MPTKATESKPGWKTVAKVRGDKLLSPNEPTTPQSIISDDAGQTVSIVYGGDRQKTLTIRLTGAKPAFEFDGLWSGRDIAIIQRHLRKAYFQHTRQLRRENLATNPVNKENEDV